MPFIPQITTDSAETNRTVFNALFQMKRHLPIGSIQNEEVKALLAALTQEMTDVHIPAIVKEVSERGTVALEPADEPSWNGSQYRPQF